MAMVQYDYDTIKKDLTQRLEKKLNGRILSNSTAMYLIEIFAERFSEIAAYNEYLTRETKWSLAQNTSSIMSQIEFFGYKQHRMKGATGKVEVSTDENFSTRYPYNVYVPKFTKFSNGNLVYCSAESAVLSSSDMFVEIPVVQGELNTTGEFAGNSFSGDSYFISGVSIENSLYELTNNGVVCTEVEWFGQTQTKVNGDVPDTYSYNNFEYMVKTLPDFSGIEIRFAPDSHDSNDHFEFRYLTTEGELGSCFDKWTESNPKNGITQVMTPVLDAQGSYVKLFVRNRSEISGGTGIESVSDMRDNAPYTFTRVDKIITRNDYIAAIREVMPNSIFEIWTEASMRYSNEHEIVQIDDATDFINNSKVFFTGVKYDESRRTISPVTSAELYDTILTKITSKKGITDYFILGNPDIFKFYLNGAVYYKSNGTTPSLVKTQTSDAILKAYPVSKSEFDKSVYRSNYTALFDNVNSLDHVDVNVVMYTEIPFSVSDTIVDVNEGGRMNFSFIPAESGEIEISGQFVFTSIDTRSESPTYQLVKDLFMLKKDITYGWSFWTLDGLTLLSNGDPSDWVVRWITDLGDIDTDGVLNEFQINLATDLGKQIYYGSITGASTGDCLDVNNLACRFVPENFNCTLSAKDQILIYSEATGDGVYGVLNPWKGQGSHNDWYSAGASDLYRYGAGLTFIAR